MGHWKGQGVGGGAEGPLGVVVEGGVGGKRIVVGPGP